MKKGLEREIKRFASPITRYATPITCVVTKGVATQERLVRVAYHVMSLATDLLAVAIAR